MAASTELKDIGNLMILSKKNDTTHEWLFVTGVPLKSFGCTFHVSVDLSDLLDTRTIGRKRGSKIANKLAKTLYLTSVTTSGNQRLNLCTHIVL